MKYDENGRNDYEREVEVMLGQEELNHEMVQAIEGGTAA